jgi:catechol 2,3-dioxygenase-like lactoylglutathione lyase family enzyme
MTPVHVVGFDHVVLNVADVERTLSFYCDRLGLTGERVDEWRVGKAPFPSARVNATTVIDFVAAPRTGENANHICLVIEPTDLDALKAVGELDVVEGPATRWGAQGYATSLYIRDPDGNTVELRYYPAQ